MSQSVPRVLLVEDNPGDARLVQEALRGSSWFPAAPVCVDTLHKALQHLAEAASWDLVLLDLGLPDSHGLVALERILQQAPAVPVVVLTGLDDEQVAMAAVKQGAQDFLVKGSFEGPLIVRTMRYAIERRHAEDALQQRMEELRVRNEELERWSRAATGRELRMIELKQEVNELCRRVGEPPRYEIPGA
jgi:DNA-binding response OmpR family regulator